MMQTLLTNIAQKRPAFTAVLLLGGLTSLALAAGWSLEHDIRWPCALLNLTGIPCPFCGSTRALAAFAQMDLVAAFRFNPLVMVAGAAALFIPLCSRYFSRWSARAWTPFWILLALNWVYLVFFLPR